MKKVLGAKCWVLSAWVLGAGCLGAWVPGAGAQSTERPAVGPERPFQLAPRLERTLPNGLRVIVTRQTAIPKVSVLLSVLSGYSSDPADQTGLAAGEDPGMVKGKLEGVMGTVGTLSSGLKDLLKGASPYTALIADGIALVDEAIKRKAYKDAIHGSVKIVDGIVGILEDDAKTAAGLKGTWNPGYYRPPVPQ